MRSFKANGGDKADFSSKSFSALRMVAKITHTAVNTPFAGVVVDWNKVNVKLSLQRGGKRFEIFSDNALPLALATGYEGGCFDEVKGGGTPYLRKLVVAAAAAKEQLAIICHIDFPTIINLKGDDKLYLELKASNDVFQAANVDTAISTIEWEMVEGVGNALGIPFIMVDSVTAGQNSSDFHFGNGVKKVLFINNDKFTSLLADQVIDTIDFVSDKLVRSDDWYELLIDRAKDFKSSTLADQRNQCFELANVDKLSKCDVPGAATDDVQLHGVDLKINFIAANVNAAKNFVVAIGVRAHTATAQKALIRNKKHEDENAAQVLG